MSPVTEAGAGAVPRTTTRVLRSDAARNQQLVIAAARDVIAESGLEASMDAIAARAGVGVGTVYRRYPSKEALIDELVRLIFDELISSAHSALDSGGLESFFWALGRSLAAHRRYADKLMGQTDSECADTLRSLIAQLHRQALDEASIAPSITRADVMAAAWGLRGVIQTSAGDPQVWPRYLRCHLRGMR
jgi:AcrR family transcriptional regulator